MISRWFSQNGYNQLPVLNSSRPLFHMIGVDLKWSQQPRETWMWQEYHICRPQGKHQPTRGWKALQGSAWNALNRSWQELGVRQQECAQDFHPDLNKKATVEIIFCGRIGTSRMWETQELVLNQRNVYIFLLTMAFFSLGLGYLRVNAVFYFIILMSEEGFTDDRNSYIPHLFKIFEKYSTISLNMGIYKKS